MPVPCTYCLQDLPPASAGSIVECPACGEQVLLPGEVVSGQAVQRSPQGGAQRSQGTPTVRRRRSAAGTMTRRSRDWKIGTARAVMVWVTGITVIGCLLWSLFGAASEERMELRVVKGLADDDYVEFDQRGSVLHSEQQRTGGQEGEVTAVLVRDYKADVRSGIQLISIISWALALVMIGLCFWAKSQPAPAISIMLVLYVAEALILLVAMQQINLLTKPLFTILLIIGTRAAWADRRERSRSGAALATARPGSY